MPALFRLRVNTRVTPTRIFLGRGRPRACQGQYAFLCRSDRVTAKLCNETASVIQRVISIQAMRRLAPISSSLTECGNPCSCAARAGGAFRLHAFNSQIMVVSLVGAGLV